MLTVIVLAHDETGALEKCIKSVHFADKILAVADSPTSRTIEVLKKLKVKTYLRSLDNDFSSQRNYALDLVSRGWVLFVDADEQVSADLAGEIEAVIRDSKAKGYYLHRVDYMWEKPLHHGDAGHTYLLRLGLKGSGRWVGRVHETWHIPGEIPRLKSELVHNPHQNLADFLKRINFYSSVRAEELSDQNTPVSLLKVVLYPIGKFAYLWIIRLGFLDGVPGFIHAMTMSFYSFLSRGKHYLTARRIS